MNIIHPEIKNFVQYWKDHCGPTSVHICDGSVEEKNELIKILLENKTIVPLKKYQDCYLARTDPRDVARVVSRTFMCTDNERKSVTIPKTGITERLGNWKDDKIMRAKLLDISKNCMSGRIMYVIPFCMGPLGSELSKIGIEITDSPYVVLSMRIMSIMGKDVLNCIDGKNFIKCVHSVCSPLKLVNGVFEKDVPWPCNPESTYITQFPDSNEIISFGSGYGGNSLLGKKCFALRLASNLALNEGWLAEHMLIMGLTSPDNQKIYIAASFPSACGKTNLAMMTPSLPGWKVTCVGDDIAWMRFDKNGVLRAINPENGFFGVCPGTNSKSNPVAMSIIKKDTLFTNVCETSDGEIFWEGLEKERDMANLKFIDWKNNEWDPSKKTLSSHPNSRFCSPLANCPILDESWDDKRGVPISAIIFGGRRPHGVPLVYESFDWAHGVLIGSCVKSETTSAASDEKAKTVVHDPFSMRPFFGYNAGNYMQHWLNVGKVEGRKLPKVFHVNWFLKDEQENYIWPGFGENSRVLKWIFDRCQKKSDAVETPIGYVPSLESFDLSGLNGVKANKLFEVDKIFWTEEVIEQETYFSNVVDQDFPTTLKEELNKLKKRLQA